MGPLPSGRRNDTIISGRVDLLLKGAFGVPVCSERLLEYGSQQGAGGAPCFHGCAQLSLSVLLDHTLRHCRWQERIGEGPRVKGFESLRAGVVVVELRQSSAPAARAAEHPPMDSEPGAASVIVGAIDQNEAELATGVAVVEDRDRAPAVGAWSPDGVGFYCSGLHSLPPWSAQQRLRWSIAICSGRRRPGN